MTQKISPCSDGPAILVLTGADDAQSARGAFAAGVRGYLRKDQISDDLLTSAIFAVANGGVFVDAQTFALSRFLVPMSLRLSHWEFFPQPRPFFPTQTGSLCSMLIEPSSPSPDGLHFAFDIHPGSSLPCRFAAFPSSPCCHRETYTQADRRWTLSGLF